MSTEPVRRADLGESQRASESDPWGVKRAEVLIGSLQGVLSARVVASAAGEIEEIHVFTQGGVAPKQVVRNVESALLAHLGLRVDHRKISVAQTAEVKPLEVLEHSAVRERASRRGLVYEALDVQSVGSRKLRFRLQLRMGGDPVVAEQESADTPNARLQAAARAAVTAIDSVLQGCTVDLEGATVIEALGRRCVFTAVYVVEGRTTHSMIGACEVKDGDEQAAVLAVLSATNRWVQSVI